MTEFTVQIPEGQISFFKNLISNLGYSYQDTPLDWDDDLTEEEKDSIKRGRADVKAGRVFSHEDVKKEIRQIIERKKTI